MDGEEFENKKIEVIYGLYWIALSYVREYYQNKVIEALAEAGIHVDIYLTGNWKEIERKYPDFVYTHEMIDPQQCVKLMRESKIT